MRCVTRESEWERERECERKKQHSIRNEPSHAEQGSKHAIVFILFLLLRVFFSWECDMLQMYMYMYLYVACVLVSQAIEVASWCVLFFVCSFLPYTTQRVKTNAFHWYVIPCHTHCLTRFICGRSLCLCMHSQCNGKMVHCTIYMANMRPSQRKISLKKLERKTKNSKRFMLKKCAKTIKWQARTQYESQCDYLFIYLIR